MDANLPTAELETAETLAISRDVPLEIVDSDRLAQLCQTYEHQGFLARMGEFPCEGADELLRTARNPASELKPALPPMFLVCDRIQDAHNFGAILRSCDAMRLDGVVIGERYQAAITPHVARSSSGAVNYQRIFRVADLAESVKSLQQERFQIIAASEKSSTSIWETSLTSPTVLLIGGETAGVAPELLALCDKHVAIPMMGHVSSLNAAVAAGIVLFECRRQQLKLLN